MEAVKEALLRWAKKIREALTKPFLLAEWKRSCILDVGIVPEGEMLVDTDAGGLYADLQYALYVKDETFDKIARPIKKFLGVDLEDEERDCYFNLGTLYYPAGGKMKAYISLWDNLDYYFLEYPLSRFEEEFFYTKMEAAAHEEGLPSLEAFCFNDLYAG